MTETTLGISNKTWAILELSSAGLLAAITARSTVKAVNKAGGLGSYLSKGDFWKSSESWSSVLVTLILLKGAVDAAKSYNLVNGVNGVKFNPTMKTLRRNNL